MCFGTHTNVIKVGDHSKPIWGTGSLETPGLRKKKVWVLLEPQPQNLQRGPLQFWTQVWIRAVSPILCKYFNRPDTSYFYLGIRKDFHISFMGPHIATDCMNLKSAWELPDIVARKIAKECEADRVAGPLAASPLHNLWVSLLGVVPQKRS